MRGLHAGLAIVRVVGDVRHGTLVHAKNGTGGLRGLYSRTCCVPFCTCGIGSQVFCIDFVSMVKDIEFAPVGEGLQTSMKKERARRKLKQEIEWLIHGMWSWFRLLVILRFLRVCLDQHGFHVFRHRPRPNRTSVDIEDINDLGGQ